MGNNLCATWQRGYRDGLRWPPAKDTHLIRLWAEIFEVREENNEVIWGRISEDVVPVNVVCVRNSPETVLQITAYNRLVEKIFDVFLTQPGTRIIQSSDCFVHWRDAKSGREWGLNFTAPFDARAFRDCCMGRFPQSFLPGKTLTADSAKPEYQQKGQTTNVLSNDASSNGYSLPRSAALVNTLQRVEGNALESARDKLPFSAATDAIPLYSSPRKLGSSNEAHHSTCCSQNAQPLQVRQVVSVYLDNGCHCSAARCVPVTRASDTCGSRSLPCGTSLYEADRSQVSQCSFQSQRGRDVVYGTMNMALFERRVCPRHACLNHCHATTDYDNSINQTIYMASKESRRMMTVERSNPALEWKDEYKSGKCKEVSGKALPSSVAIRGNIFQDQSVTEQLTGIQKDSFKRMEAERLVKAGGIEGNSSGEVWQKRKSVISMDWPPPPPPESPGIMSPVHDPVDYSATVLNRGSIPASLNNVKLETNKVEVIRTSQEEQITNQGGLPLSTTYTTTAVTTKLLLDRVHDSIGDKTVLNCSVTCAPPSKICTADVVTSKAARVTPTDIVCDTLKAKHILQTEIVQEIPQPMESAVIADSEEIEAATDDQSSYNHSLDGAATQSQREEATSSRSGPEKLQSDDLRRDSGSWPESAEVRRLMTSDISGSEGGSDAEDGYDCSSLHTMPSQASFASKSTVVRRAGWLTVKNWLVRRKHKIELASKRTWKKYWVCLKGNILLFYVADDGVPLTDNASPRHKLVIEGGLAQPAPEHPKKENAFSLSTAFGDAYLFQASSQVDLDNWVSAIHSACAASLARQHGRENTLRLLGGEIRRLETSIDLDIKMKKMGLMHLATVNDSRSRQAIERQLNQWDQNLEKFYIDHYRLRCYSASLQGSELPNPKLVLGSVSKNTKVFLSRIGAFTVSAFHAFVYARSFSPGTSTSLVAPSTPNRPLSTFKAETLNTAIGPRMQSSRMLGLPPNQKNRGSTDARENDLLPLPPDQLTKSLLRVKLPNSQGETSIQVTPVTTIQELVEAACNKYRLNTKDHFARMILPGSAGIKVPDKNALLRTEDFENVEVCPKLIHQLELVRSAGDFGFQVEAELAEDAEEEDELCLFVSEVTPGRTAAVKGVFVGDEILVINGKVVSELDMVYIENLFLECNTICMTLRSCQIDRHQMMFDPKLSNMSYGIETLMCPPPPTQTPITDQNIGDLIVPAPNLDNFKDIPDLLRTRVRTSDSGVASEQIDDLLKGVNQVMHLCRRQYSLRCSEHPNNGNNATLLSSSQPLSNSQRICKVVLELIDTERFYVRDLTCLIERYLEPLKDETYISSDDVEQLFGNIQEIVQFQRLFLHSLEDAVRSDQNFNRYDDNSHLTDEGLVRVLMLIGNSFLYYAHHFKLYSSFCASHSKAQKMILSDDNAALREFLRARNPKQQHSAALESYLIKPIQRILKYPLLLKQLHELTDPRSDENALLKDALQAMESVAEHINEMQKIYEEYGRDFEELVRIEKQERVSYKNISLSVGELQMYGTVNWINATDEVVKPRKGCDLLTLIFIFKSAVVILAQERQRAKKRASKATGAQSEPTRFKIAIPIGELQVRSVIGDPSDCRGVWEIVYCRSEKEGRPKKTYQFISSLKARNDFIRTIHRMMHEKYDTARRISVTGQPGQTVQSPRCAQHQQPKFTHTTHSMETGHKLRNQAASKGGQPSPSKTQNGTVTGTSSSTTSGNSSVATLPLKNNFNPLTSPSPINRNPMGSSPYTMDSNPNSYQNDKKASLVRRDVTWLRQGEDLSLRQAEKLDSRQSSAQMPEKTQEP